MRNCPRIAIAGIKGGSGKTTLSLGIARAWSRKGLKVVPFKKGPDYIDAGWLSYAAGQSCYTLDPFLFGSDALLSSFAAHSEGSDISLIEGNRGLYDGMDEEGSYSTAEVAKMLRSPVVLIIDCSKVTRTVAAVLLGVRKFDPHVDIKGVVLNQTAGSRHESVIRASIEKYCDVPVVGAIPRLDEDMFPMRHMGLIPFQEHPAVERTIDSAADIISRYADIERLFEIAGNAAPLPEVRNSLFQVRNPREEKPLLRVGVIRDSAFQFYYPENIEELERHGAEIIEFSALTEKKLPDIDCLYIGGGFPETHAITLAENSELLSSVKNSIEDGLPVYAECGGLMYLGKGIIVDGRMHQMAGVFPLVFSLERKPQAHGYSIVETVKGNPFYRPGTILRGHEFHYSNPVNATEYKDAAYAFRMKRGNGIFNGMDGIFYKNCLAAYTHLHAFGAREWVKGILHCAAEFRKLKKNSRPPQQRSAGY